MEDNLTVDPIPVPSQPMPHKPNYLLLFLILILIITIVVLSYFVWTLKVQVGILNLASGAVKEDTTFQVNQSTPSTVVQDETANWKTYSNHRFNFSFKYPSDFKMDETIGEDDAAFRVGFTNGQTKDAEGNSRGIENDKMAVYVYVSDYKEFLSTYYRYGGYEWTRSVIELLSKAKNGARMSHNNGDTTDNVDNQIVTKIGDVNIDGFVGVKYKEVPTVEGSSSISVALMKGNRTILVNALTGDDSLVFTRPYSNTFDQILSTLKFL